MKPLRNDITGQRFGALVAVTRYTPKSDVVKFVCRCDCGRYLICRADNLRSGHTRQCSVCNGGHGSESVFLWKGGVKV